MGEVGLLRSCALPGDKFAFRGERANDPGHGACQKGRFVARHPRVEKLDAGLRPRPKWPASLNVQIGPKRSCDKLKECKPRGA